MGKYKAYLVLRERLLNDTQRLRANIGAAPPPPVPTAGPGSLCFLDGHLAQHAEKKWGR